MAGSIKGITIELGGDTTKLDKALQGVNTKSKDLQSELRQVDKLLKLDPSNVTLVAQKQKLLTEAVQNTSAKLETLKTAEKQAQEQFKKGEISEEQYRALQREIVATEQKLNGYQNELREVGAESKKTAASTKEIGDSATKTTPHMKNFSAGSVAAIAAIGAAAVAAVAAIKNIAEKVKDAAFGMAEYADEVNTLAAKYKVSSDTIQKWMYIAKIADTEVEVMGGSLAKLVRAINSAERGTEDQVKAFKALGVEYKKSNGKFRDTEDVFYDLVDALGKMDDETQADIYSNALFSRSFQDLNPLIATGSEGIKELSDKAEELGLVLGEEQLAKLNAFQDSIDTLQSQVKIAAAPFVEGLIPAFQSVAGIIQDKLGDPKVKDALGKFGDKLGELALKITDKLVEFLESDSFENVAKGIGQLATAITNNVIWFFDTAMPWIVDHQSEIKTAMEIIGTGMAVAGFATGNFAVGLAGVAMVAPSVISGMNGVSESTSSAVESMSATLDGFANKDLGEILSNIPAIFNGMYDETDSIMIKRGASILGGFATMGTNIISGFYEMGNRLVTDFMAMVEGFKSAMSAVGGFFQGVWGGIVSTVQGAINSIIDGINRFISGINVMISGLNSIKLPSFLGGGSVNIPYVRMIPKWNAEGVLFDKPTILPTIAGLQGVGEAGAEITAPLAKLQNLMINTAKETGGGKTVNITINTQSMTPAQETRLINRINYELGMA